MLRMGSIIIGGLRLSVVPHPVVAGFLICDDDGPPIPCTRHRDAPPHRFQAGLGQCDGDGLCIPCHGVQWLGHKGPPGPSTFYFTFICNLFFFVLFLEVYRQLDYFIYSYIFVLFNLFYFATSSTWLTLLKKIMCVASV